MITKCRERSYVLLTLGAKETLSLIRLQKKDLLESGGKRRKTKRLEKIARPREGRRKPVSEKGVIEVI